MINQLKKAETDEERMFFLNLLEAGLEKEMEKIKFFKEKIKKRNEYRKFKEESKKKRGTTQTT